MKGVVSFLKERTEGEFLPWQVQQAAATSFGIHVSEVECVALENDILPARYRRNRQMLSCQQQLQLFESKVAVAGCGGLGGYIIEELTRLGVGQVVAVDPDVFEEHNLNRQILSSLAALGRAKVEVAAERMADINPAVTVIPIREALDRKNAVTILEQVSVVADALDSSQARLEISAACRDAGIPVVHGAIGGWYGQVTTQFPGENNMEKLYQGVAGRGIEKVLGNPSFTPAVIAGVQVAEICKLLLGEGETLRGKLLSIDLRCLGFTTLVTDGTKGDS